MFAERLGSTQRTVFRFDNYRYCKYGENVVKAGLKYVSYLPSVLRKRNRKEPHHFSGAGAVT
jgi:hypothetical protein